MKRILKMVLSRTTLIGLLLLMQIAVFFVIIYNFSNIPYVSWGLYAVSTFIVIYLVYREENPIYKMSWIVPILIFPLFGGLFYLFYRSINVSNSVKQKFMELEINRASYISLPSPSNEKAFRYLDRYNWPAYQHTQSTFLGSGELMFEDLKKEIKRAKHYIFLEFFIISPGKMWDEILSLLKEKAQQGVDIKLIYDDFGSYKLPFYYPKQLKAFGIDAYQFNKMRIHINFAMNYRDHRKIVVIDNQVGFTGGINIGDEYINLEHPFGHWQDAGIKLEGDAVWSLTLAFLQTLSFLTAETINVNQYRLKQKIMPKDGFVAPFTDGPINGELVTKNIYLSLITQATHDILITTPYLIIDYELTEALKLAVKSGVHVKIVIPNIPDKKIVYMVTESYANDLFATGIEIYRYKPGFIHSKMMIIDQKYAFIGTANFDFRSLYLHFENNVYLSNVSTIKEMVQYMNDVISRSELMDQLNRRSIFYHMMQYILRGFATLM